MKSQVPGGKPQIFSETPGFPGPGFSLNPGIGSISGSGGDTGGNAGGNTGGMPVWELPAVTGRADEVLCSQSC